MNSEPINRALNTLAAEKKAVNGLKKTLNKEFIEAISFLKNRSGKVILTGIGKSGFIAQKIAATLTSLGQSSVYLHPVEAMHGDIGVISEGDVIIALSFSGESPEIIKLIKYLKKDFGTKIISITNSRKNSLGKLSDKVIQIKVDDEGCPVGVAPMASTTAMLIVGDMIAAALTSPNNFKKDNFARFHPGGGLAMSLKPVESIMRKREEIPMVKENSNFKLILSEMNKKKMGITGVLNIKNKLTGVITDGDIRRYFLSHENIKGITAIDLMTKTPKNITKNVSLKDAIELMEKYKITSLFVVEKNKPLGIIHIHDILEKSI